MCLVLLPTSFVQHSHIYGIGSEISELHCHLGYTLYFAQAITLKPS